MKGEVDHAVRNKTEIDDTASIQDSYVGPWTKIGARTQILETHFGDYSYVMNDCEIAYSVIGKFCSIASHTRINPPNHPLWRATSHHFTYRSRFYEFGDDEESFFEWRRNHKVVLGHDVWIGHGAIILPGVYIGTGAVVGAGSVVTKEIPPYSIVAGNPARMIRRRVRKEEEAALIRIAWWNWSHEEIRKALKDFRELNLHAFINKYDPEKAQTLTESRRTERLWKAEDEVRVRLDVR